jgi:protease I
VELTRPREALQEAGATVDLVSPKSGEIQGFKHHDKADRFRVDRTVKDAKPDAYDALVLPGGVINPDALRLSPESIDFVRHFIEAEKPIASICHGPWTLIDAGGVGGKRVTSWPSLKVDLSNAGAEWVDREVVTDGWLVTSRKPADLPAFCREMIEIFAEAHAETRAAE